VTSSSWEGGFVGSREGRRKGAAARALDWLLCRDLELEVPGFRLRIEFLANVALAIAVVAVAFGVFYTVGFHYYPATVLLIAAAVGALLTIPLVRRTRSLFLASSLLNAVLLCCLGLLASLRPDFPVSTLMWGVVLPLVSFYVCGRAHALVWTLAMAVLCIGFAVRSQLGWASAAFPADEVDILIADTVALLFLVAVLLLFSATIRRHSSESERQRSQVMLRLQQGQREQAIGVLAAGVAREIETPLNQIAQELEGIIGELDEGERGAERASRALARTWEVQRIVQDLGLYGRDRERAEQSVLVAQVLRSALHMVRFEIRNKARLDLRIDDVPVVHADAGQLFQVFLNLLLNAVQAIGEGSVEDNEIGVALWQRGGQVYVAIRDTGRGIEPAAKEHLFEPSRVTEGPAGDPGVGLVICHQIVSSLGGRIDVESTVGEGSLFRVVLPLGS